MRAFLWMVVKIILDAAFGVYLTLGAAFVEMFRLRAGEYLRIHKWILLCRKAREEQEAMNASGEIPTHSLGDCLVAMGNVRSNLTWRQIYIVWRLK